MAKVKVNRSAVTGRFVKKSFAKRHKRTTVTEKIIRSGRRKSKR
jgi:hypothetical protein